MSPEEEQRIADYEQEISISIPYDKIDEEMARFYPNLIGNGHPDVCLCPQCAPNEYNYFCCPCGEYVSYDDTSHSCVYSSPLEETTPAVVTYNYSDVLDDVEEHPF
jgi:hypothetical protein